MNSRDLPVLDGQRKREFKCTQRSECMWIKCNMFLLWEFSNCILEGNHYRRRPVRFIHYLEQLCHISFDLERMLLAYKNSAAKLPKYCIMLHCFYNILQNQTVSCRLLNGGDVLQTSYKSQTAVMCTKVDILLRYKLNLGFSKLRSSFQYRSVTPEIGRNISVSEVAAVWGIKSSAINIKTIDELALQK